VGEEVSFILFFLACPCFLSTDSHSFSRIPHTPQPHILQGHTHTNAPEASPAPTPSQHVSPRQPFSKTAALNVRQSHPAPLALPPSLPLCLPASAVDGGGGNALVLVAVSGGGERRRRSRRRGRGGERVGEAEAFARAGERGGGAGAGRGGGRGAGGG
jgi:hypothetical protein